MNRARGTRLLIADRMDLTLECIRRHYTGGPDSPLSDVATAYKDFFELFGRGGEQGFKEFVDFLPLSRPHSAWLRLPGNRVLPGAEQLQAVRNAGHNVGVHRIQGESAGVHQKPERADGQVGQGKPQRD